MPFSFLSPASTFLQNSIPLQNEITTQTTCIFYKGMSSPPSEKKARMDAADLPEGVLFGMGNPLLDISAEDAGDLLKKYDLQPNNAILAEEKHIPIYQDLVDNYSVEYIAGGATQNSIRVAQWMMQRRFATSYLGCVGKDSFGEQLEKQAKGAGVKVQYMVVDDKPTGTCAVVITEKVRSLVANLGAANSYKIEHLKEEENWKLVERAKICYIAGFFLTVSVDSILAVAKHCMENNKLFIMNLSAPFICQFFKDQLLQVMPYIDILICNEAEGAAFSEAMGYDTKDLKEVLGKAAALPKERKSQPRVVIFTQGPNPILLCKDGKITEFSILPIKEEEILDTNGAGDAWVGGFLSQLVLDRSVEEAIHGGNYAANVVIKRSGCTFPEKPNFVPPQ